MRNIKELLQRVLSQLGLDKKIEEYRAFLLWDDVASSVSFKTEPVEILRGRLVVNVADSVVMHMLTFYKRRYIDKINLILGKQVLKDIIFRVGKVEKKGVRAPQPESRNDYIRRLHSIQLDQDELTKIDEIVSLVEDEEIRDSLRELFVNQSKLSKMRGGG